MHNVTISCYDTSIKIVIRRLKNEYNFREYEFSKYISNDLIHTHDCPLPPPPQKKAAKSYQMNLRKTDMKKKHGIVSRRNNVETIFYHVIQLLISLFNNSFTIINAVQKQTSCLLKNLLF